MKVHHFLLAGALAACAAASLAAEGDAAKALPSRVPVIFDTDIGDDCDDTWALTLLLKSPQFDVKLVTTTCGKAEYRAKIIAKLLSVARRTDIPVGLGEGGREGTGKQQAWVEGYKLDQYPGKIIEDGAGAVIDVIRRSPQTVTVICVGPLHTMAKVLERDPTVAAEARFAGMFGSVRKGYGDHKIDAEYNVANNPAAARTVLSAPWRQITITPLDTCGLVRLSGDRFQTLKQSRDPMVQALLENYRIWAGKLSVDELKASSILFDTVAVYLANTGDRPLLKLETLSIKVTDDGHTVVDPQGRQMSVATAWNDLDGFCDLLMKSLGGE